MHSSQVNDAAIYIAPSQEADFRKRLGALNKKAAKFGLQPIEIQDSALCAFQVKTEVQRNGSVLFSLVPLPAGARTESPVTLQRYKLRFPLIKLGNWQVVGKLELCGESNLAFSITPEQADIEELGLHAQHKLHCQHCNAKRTRKEGFLLRGEDARYMQVGTSCLKDFTGIDPAAALFLAQMWTMVRDYDADFDEFGRSGRTNAVHTLSYLAAVSFLSKVYGFVSSSRARDEGIPATYDDAIGLSEMLRSNEALRERYLASLPEHEEVAQKVRAWVLGKEPESMFDRNVQLLLKQDCLTVNHKHLAFAAATVPMYAKSLELASKSQRPPGVHVGEVGQKLSMTLTFERIITFESRFGMTSLVLMRDAQGNALTWKTGSCPQRLGDAKQGDTFDAAFKIKEHAHYKGQPQTSVSHLKLLEQAQPA